jgi:hypothetical protein
MRFEKPYTITIGRLSARSDQMDALDSGRRACNELAIGRESVARLTVVPLRSSLRQGKRQKLGRSPLPLGTAPVRRDAENWLTKKSDTGFTVFTILRDSGNIWLSVWSSAEATMEAGIQLTAPVTDASIPDWRELYKAALFEDDNSKILQRIAEAEVAVSARAGELFGTSGRQVREQHDIENALYFLGLLRKIETRIISPVNLAPNLLLSGRLEGM